MLNMENVIYRGAIVATYNHNLHSTLALWNERLLNAYFQVDSVTLFQQNIFLCSEWNAKMPIKSPPPNKKKGGER